MTDAAAKKLDPRFGFKILAVAVTYLLFAKLSLEPPFIDGALGRIVWPASGFALAVRNCLPLWVDQGDGGVVGSTKD